jgi:RimJ/RimL family protein N-acetyltransferase
VTQRETHRLSLSLQVELLELRICSTARITNMESERLRYSELSIDHLDSFHRLVQDVHVRRYLLDGEVLPREWSAERIRESRSLFERRGVGIWLVNQKVTQELVGFCGFLEMATVHHEPQLVYAMFQEFTGKGYATEMARTVIAAARQHRFATIIASVDEVNGASFHVLEKLGFERIETLQGAFGNMLLLRLDATTL